MMRIRAVILLLLILVAAALAVLPSLMTAPFLSQTTLHLTVGHAATRWAPGATLVLLLVGIVLAVTSWRAGLRAWGKVGVIASCVVLALLAQGARLRPAEIRFARLTEVIRVSNADASQVKPSDMVLGVTAGGEAAAYPLPVIAFHHIVNDRLGDEPFVVTY
jgi:hypothetical protein